MSSRLSAAAGEAVAVEKVYVMIDLALSFLFFARPISYTGYAIGFGGALEIFAMLTFGVLVFLLVSSLRTTAVQRVSGVDLFVMLFMLCVLGASLIYLEKSKLKDVAKFLLPFFSYIAVRNCITGREQYLRLLWWMIVGFAVPVVTSAILIALHKGVYVHDYWTGLWRFTGTYLNPHDFGHNMTFFVMLVVVYLTLRSSASERKSPLGIVRKVLLGTLVMLALYCLYKSYVRTAYLGLVIFMLVYLYIYNKKLLIVTSAGLVVTVFALWSVWALIFHDVVEVSRGERSTDRIASGRPYIWKHNLDKFSEVTFDRQLMGVGVGNRIDVLTEAQGRGSDDFWNSHNDYLEVFIQTGAIGFVLYMAIQFLLFLAILRMPHRERGVFLALFVAVAFMNFASNSYVARFGLGQALYFVLAYVEVARWSAIATKKTPVKGMANGRTFIT